MPRVVPLGQQPTGPRRPPPEPPDWQVLLATRQFTEIEAALGPLVERSNTDPAAHRDLDAATRLLTRGKPVDVAPLDRWVAATGHGLAHLVRGRFYRWRAWQARGQQAVSTTGRLDLDRFERLQDHANSDFQRAVAKLGPQCDACQAGVFDTWMTTGQGERAARHIDDALMALQGGILTPSFYLHYLFPRWSGPHGKPAAFVERFSRDFPHSPAIPLLQSALLAERGEALWAVQRSPQARPLLEEAVRLDPYNGNAWNQLLEVGVSLNDQALVLRASAQAMALLPDERRPLEARAFALLQGATPAEAVPLLEQAVALGSSWALERLMPILATGQLGFAPDRARTQALCQSAIDAGLAGGFACMGGLEFFGIGRPVNRAVAFQWFVEAGERGVPAAMTDVGIMLSRGDGVKASEDAAIQWWLRAHRSGEPRADGYLRDHLSSLGYARRVSLPLQLDRITSAIPRGLRWATLGLGVELALALVVLFVARPRQSGRRSSRRNSPG